MSKYRYLFLVLVLVALSLGTLIYSLRYERVSIKQFNTIDRPPNIRPDYTDAVIPPNIAPLNFLVQEEGLAYCVKVYSKHGKSIEVFSRRPKIIIPQKSWHRLLHANKGQQLYFDVFVKTGNSQWNRFSTIANKIAPESIDDFLIYRKIRPGYSTWRDIGIYQRNLRNYNESLVLSDSYFKNGCLNCHTFCNNQTDKALFPTRSLVYGTDSLLIEDGQVQKIGAKFTYASWHPSGRLVAYSVNNVRQFVHTFKRELRGVIDLDSLLAYYIVNSKTIKTSSKFSRKDYLETYPTWSPDGRYLYFCSAPILWSSQDKIPPDRYEEVKYDLVRINYDIDSDQWGQLETVVSANDTGLSVAYPRISPDGKWLLLCMADYGTFHVYSPSSDLYLLDLQAAHQTGQYAPKRLEINSDESESWHCWSSNSRWIVFSSKRDYGVFTRSYISYVDETGKVHKPLVVPQKDPAFYDSCLKTYNTPELVIEPVPLTGEKLAKVVRSSAKIPVDMPITMATPKAGTVPATGQWQGQRE
jgi:hypothetical protein